MLNWTKGKLQRKQKLPFFYSLQGCPFEAGQIYSVELQGIDKKPARVKALGRPGLDQPTGEVSNKKVHPAKDRAARCSVGKLLTG